MANQAKGQARDFAFLPSGKLCSTLRKQFSICVIFIWNKSLFFIANIKQLPMPSKLCWFQNHPSSLQCLVNAGHAAPRRVLSSWDTIFGQNLTVDERRSSFYQKMSSLDFLKGLGCWWIMFCLNEVVQATTRSLAVSNLVTFFSTDRSSSLHKISRQLSSPFEFSDWWLIMSHLNEVMQAAIRSLAASNSVTFFSTDRWEVVVLHPSQKNPTAVKHFWVLFNDD